MHEDRADKQNTPPRIRVVLADPSLMLRRSMARILGKTPDIALVSTAETAKETLAAIRNLQPDVLILDLAGDGLDGLTVLRRIRTERLRCSVILFSAQTMESAESTIHGMELGASDFVAKPQNGSFAQTLSVIERELLPRLRVLGQHSRVLSGDPPRFAGSGFPAPAARAPKSSSQALSALPRHMESSFPTGVVAIGASTGGPEALMRLLPLIPEDFPTPILVVQHMPPLFTGSFATRLDQVCALRVVEALDGEPLLGGTVYVSPGDRHMTVIRDGTLLRVRLTDDPPVHSCRPATDVLFNSAANLFGPHVLGIVLTGMGTDGTQGAMAIREKGGRVIVQDAETCLIYGMPKSVYDAGLANEQLPIPEIAARIKGIFF